MLAIRAVPVNTAGWARDATGQVVPKHAIDVKQTDSPKQRRFKWARILGNPRPMRRQAAGGGARLGQYRRCEVSPPSRACTWAWRARLPPTQQQPVTEQSLYVQQATGIQIRSRNRAAIVPGAGRRAKWARSSPGNIQLVCARIRPIRRTIGRALPLWSSGYYRKGAWCDFDWISGRRPGISCTGYVAVTVVSSRLANAEPNHVSAHWHRIRLMERESLCLSRIS